MFPTEESKDHMLMAALRMDTFQIISGEKFKKKKEVDPDKELELLLLKAQAEQNE